MIALILGGAPTWLDEAKAAAALLNRPHLVVAANLAGIHWPGKLDAHVTLHPDQLESWRAQRKGPAAARIFAPSGRKTPKWAEIAEERWPGSSGLYAAQVALFDLGASGAILCGIPMDSAAGHFDRPPGARWEAVGDYRAAFAAALPEIGGRIRSMGGWTADLFGEPTAEWVGAIDNTRPAGVSAPKERLMHKVKNTTNVTQTFWAPNEAGLLKLHRLGPGESVTADVDVNQPKFGDDGPFSVTAVSTAAPKRKAAPAKKKSQATKAKAAATVKPSSEPSTPPEA